MWTWLRDLRRGRGHRIEELARRLGVEVEELRAFRPTYREFAIPKRSGGERRILAPEPETRELQRRILRRLLGRLKAHPAAHGFERRRSIATNARPHVGAAVVARFDLVDFFPSTDGRRVEDYLRGIGWDREASRILARICTHEGGLPQGAPTSPRLSNLVNIRLDARLAGLAARYGGTYTRYADDLTFSFPVDEPGRVAILALDVDRIVRAEGYRLHSRKKRHVRRRHQRQVVTGLVVNERVDLPRETRRRLRAVEHRLRTGRPATLTPEQLRGWRAFESMVLAQASQD